jgi:hypothetical protein
LGGLLSGGEFIPGCDAGEFCEGEGLFGERLFGGGAGGNEGALS